MKVTPPTIRLESKSFTMIAKPVQISDGWYEFEVECGGVKYENIGGQTKDYFINTMLEILEKKEGVKLGTRERSPYMDYVGGNQAEYLGYLVLSGYTTFYFFKLGERMNHIVMADSNGKMLVHSKLDSNVADIWRTNLLCGA